MYKNENEDHENVKRGHISYLELKKMKIVHRISHNSLLKNQGKNHSKLSTMVKWKMVEIKLILFLFMPKISHFLIYIFLF